MTLDEVRSRPSTLDEQRFDALTESRIRAFTREDGFDPDGELQAGEATVLPQAVRHRLSTSPAQFAAALRTPLSTLNDWESGRVRPHPAARSLLLAVFRNPEAVLAAIAA